MKKKNKKIMCSLQEWSPVRLSTRIRTQILSPNPNTSESLLSIDAPIMRRGSAEDKDKEGFQGSDAPYLSLMGDQVSMKRRSREFSLRKYSRVDRVEAALKDENGRDKGGKRQEEGEISVVERELLAGRGDGSAKSGGSEGSGGSGSGGQSRRVNKEGNNRNSVSKKLENLQVGYKNLSEWEDQARLQIEAKEFVNRLKRQKREFQGQLYMIKREQEQRRKMDYLAQASKKLEQRQRKKLQRMKQIQKRLQQFKAKQIQRSQRQQIQKQRSVSLAPISKLDVQPEPVPQAPSPPLSPTYRLGKKYLLEAGRIKKRVKTESTHYSSLTPSQRNQLDQIRHKIDLLTKTIK